MGNQTDRKELLHQLKTTKFDVLIIGGGATGCGIALEAASRGLSVALVEREDFASGTSSRSTKLVHGGVRYLEKAVHHLDSMQYNLVHEALRERAIFFRIAPFAVRRLPILTPIYRWHKVLYFWLGLKVYDWIAGKGSLGPSHFLPRKKALQRFPLLKDEGLKGAVVYYDGQFNDARMALLVALTAIEQGACCATHCEVTNIDEEKVTVRDALSNEIFTVVAKQVVNATGPFTDEVRRLANSNSEPLLKPSAGTHVLLPGHYCPNRTGMLIPNTRDDRILFLLPWEGYAVAGTTDLPTKVSHLPRPTKDEVSFILDHLSSYFGKELRKEEVLSSWTGLRPLVTSKKSSANASRDHLIHREASGMLTITGGKWTTYRRMAEELVDELHPPKESRTQHLYLVGAHEYGKDLSMELQKRYALPRDCAAHLVRSYGTRARELLEQAETVDRLVEGMPYLQAEISFACRAEFACRATDFLARRSRIVFLDRQKAREVLPTVVSIMSKELGWSAERRQAESELAEQLINSMEPTNDLHP